MTTPRSAVGLALTLLLISAPARAADLPAGSDAQVAAAIAKAAAGDTITLAPGDYAGGWILPPGQTDKPITLRAAAAGRVFVKCLDITKTPVGLQLADHTRVEGLAMTGFSAGVHAKIRTDVAVTGCVFYANRSGVVFTSCKEGLVARCEFFSDPSPNATRGVQLVSTRGGQGIVWEHNIVHTTADFESAATMIGEAPYTDSAVLWNIFEGLAKNSLVIDPGAGDSVDVENNVGQGLFSGGKQALNTCAAVEPKANDNDQQIASLDEKWKFADPAWLDYRLQPDSPARAGHRGAFPFADEIRYVDPAAGDDAGPGNTRAAPWRSLAVAARKLQTGQTLYLLPGQYPVASLAITGLHASGDKPILIRAYGRAKIDLAEIVIKDCENLRIEGLQTAHLSIDGSADVTISRCTIARGQGATFTGNDGTMIDHCMIWANKAAGLTFKECNVVSITSTAVLLNADGSILGSEHLPGYYQRFNLGIGPDRLPPMKPDEMKLPPGTETAGRYGQPIGP